VNKTLKLFQNYFISQVTTASVNCAVCTQHRQQLMNFTQHVSTTRLRLRLRLRLCVHKPLLYYHSLSRSLVTLEFKNFQGPLYDNDARYQKIFHILYTASLHAVNITLQQNQ